MARGSGAGNWKESPKKNAVNELKDQLVGTNQREAQAKAELCELRQITLQLEKQVSSCYLGYRLLSSQVALSLRRGSGGGTVRHSSGRASSLTLNLKWDSSRPEPEPDPE